jgi:signal transduction histidine kinase
MKALLINNIKANQDFKVVLVVIFYLVAVQVGLSLTFPLSKAAVFWPPSGLALAIILIYGRQVWPAVAIGSLAAGISLIYHYGISLSFDVIITLLLFMVVHTVEALLTYFLILKLINSRNPFLKTSHIFIFIIITLTVTSLSAVIISLGLLSSGIINNGNFLQVMTSYFSSQWVGILIFTPFIISWSRRFNFKLNKMIAIEAFIFVTLMFAVISSLSFESIAPIIVKAFPFLMMPFLLWLAFRANSQITLLAILAMAVTAVYFTIQGLGPFVLENEEQSLLMLQIFLAITSIIAIVLNTTVWERTLAEKAIRQFNEKLEDSVQKRTRELHEEIAIRRATEDKIKISNRQLRKANAELDNFVYSVSHDLRAPIASVLGLVNLAKKEKDIKMMYKYVEMVEKSASQQDAFIKDILNLSRNSRLEISNDPIAFEEMIAEIFEQLQYYQDNKKINKEVNIEQSMNFHSDQKRLKVIFNNLISNAIRYSNGHDPVIKINISVDDATAKIKIQDNGIGIDEQHLKKVFNMFYRATDDNAGSGLGLYIVKETVEKLKGNVSLESKHLAGTTVNLEIPNHNLN